MIIPDKDQISLALLQFDLMPDERLARMSVDLMIAVGKEQANTEVIFGYILGLIAADIAQNPQG